MRTNKKGQNHFGLASLVSVVIIFLVAAIMAIYSIDIMDDTRKDFCDYNYEAAEQTCYQCDNATYPSFNSTDNKCYNATSGDLSSISAVVNQPSSFNATTDSIDGVRKIPKKMPTIGNVVIAAIIIGVLLSAFGGFLVARKR